MSSAGHKRKYCLKQNLGRLLSTFVIFVDAMITVNQSETVMQNLFIDERK